MLEKKGLKAPTAVKTGTTIAGLIFKVNVYSVCESRLRVTVYVIFLARLMFYESGLPDNFTKG